MAFFTVHRHFLLSWRFFICHQIIHTMKREIDDDVRGLPRGRVYELSTLSCAVDQQVSLRREQGDIKGGQLLNYPSQCNNDVISKRIDLRFPNCLLSIQDQYAVNYQLPSTSTATASGNPSKQEKSNDNESEEKHEQGQLQGQKKVVLFRRRLRGGMVSTGGDKKNIVKNVVTSFLNYLREIKQEGHEVSQQIALLELLVRQTKYNNHLVTLIIDDQALRYYFRDFLTESAPEWIHHSKLKNKEIHEEAISVYLRLCDERNSQSGREEKKASSGSNSKDENELLFQSGLNHELEEQLANIK